MTVAPPSSIDISVEELVLDGFDAHDREAIGDAVREEMSRLVSTRPVPRLLAGSIEVDRLDGGAVEVPRGLRPRDIGRRVAAAALRSFGP
jgi:hypothetical protein